MRFESIKSFNLYTKNRSPKCDVLDIGEYPANFLLSSKPVYPNFYRISIKYGLEDDKTKGFMYFSSPNQPIEWQTETPWKGFFINITEDLISNNQYLKYSFLNYGLHEPLFLKKDEEFIITQHFKAALSEYDKEPFALDLVLAYCNIIFAHVSQCYARQFGERKEQHNQLVAEFFKLLENYYNTEEAVIQPSVNYFANHLNITPNYLSDVIKFHSGKPALEHIHNHIIEVAKVLLLQRSNSIKEIAYRLGFEYPNYFSRLFRKSTGLSPSQYQNQ
ncbi:MAG: helix-turn-helix domain-containing protein [Bacteroidota bacterium]